MSERRASGGISAELEHDFANLHALIADYAERQEVPCVNGPMRCAPGWISDDERQQAEIAPECLTCPAVGQCRAYGLRNPREHGVYGGLTTSERQRAMEGVTP